MHPAYEQGMPRLSCRFCISRRARRSSEPGTPYATVEREIDYSFTKDLKITEILEAVECGEMPSSVMAREM